MGELHIGADGQLHTVVAADETSSYAQELAQVQLQLATTPDGEERADLQQQENNLLLCLASLRWNRAMTQLQAEGVLSKEVGQRPLALGHASYYAQSTRDSYYKVWRVGEYIIASEILSQGRIYYDEGTARFGSVGLYNNPGWGCLPCPTLAAVHFRDYQNMVAVVTSYEDTQVVTNAVYGFRTQWHRRNGTVWVQSPNSFEEVQQPARLPRWAEFTKCRVCGCTNDDCRQCIEASGQPCSWAAPYLCTRCYAEQKGGPAT